MTPEREKDIQQTVIRVISGFGVDLSEPYQSISWIGLREFRRDVSNREFIDALKAMEGVILDTEEFKVRVPTGYFQ